MSLLNPAYTATQTLLDSIRDAETQAEEAKSKLDLLTTADLRRRKLKQADIDQIPQTLLEGRKRPLYQLSEVQKYLDKKTPNKL